MARKEKPSGREIAEKAKEIRLVRSNSAQGEIKGKKAKFTSANLTHLMGPKEIEEGHVVGVLDTEIKGVETRLPPGKYNIFLAKVGDTWKAYAESGGEIVAEAARATVELHEEGEHRMAEAQFNPEGWCFCWCLYSIWWWCIVWVCFCF